MGGSRIAYIGSCNVRFSVSYKQDDTSRPVRFAIIGCLQVVCRGGEIWWGGGGGKIIS